MEGRRFHRPNLDDDRWLRAAVIAAPAVAISIIVALKILAPHRYQWFVREDGPVEWATALAFVMAAPLALSLARALRRQEHPVFAALYALLAAGLVFMALEEISWGQRILGLETPEYFVEHSTKPEINVHNLAAFPLGFAFIAVGCYGAFSRLLAPGPLRRRFPLAVELLTPRPAIAGYFLLTFVFYSYFEYIWQQVMRPLGVVHRRDYHWEGYFVVGKDQEPIELVLALGFLVFVFDNWQRHRSVKPAGGSGAVRPG